MKGRAIIKGGEDPEGLKMGMGVGGMSKGRRWRVCLLEPCSREALSRAKRRMWLPRSASRET